jgi:protein FrlC
MAIWYRNRLACSGAHYRYYPFDYFVERQRRQGFTTMDLWAGPPHAAIYHDSCPDLHGLRRRLDTAGISISALTPECRLSHYSLCAFDTYARDKSLAYFANVIQTAVGLGAPLVILSCHGAAWDRGHDEAFRNAGESLRHIAPLAAKAGVTLAVETAPAYESCVLNTIEELDRLLGELAHPSLRVCLNLTAAVCASESLDSWFSRFGDRLVHIHFADGRPQGYLAWGDGLLPLDEYLDTFNRQGYQGYLGLLINDTRYLEQPEKADRNMMQSFEPFLEHEWTETVKGQTCPGGEAPR